MCGFGIAGTLFNDQTHPWEQENKRSHVACGCQISRTVVQWLNFVPVTQGTSTFGVEHCTFCFALFRVKTSCGDWLLSLCVEYYWFRRMVRELGNATEATNIQETRGRLVLQGCWCQRKGLSYLQEMCKFQVIILWDLVPYSAIIHQRFRLKLCPHRQEGGENRGCQIDTWIMVTPYASDSSVTWYLWNW